MFNWLRELMELRAEFRLRRLNDEAIQCETCEVLKMTLAQVNREKEVLLNRLLAGSVEDLPKTPPVPEPIQSRFVPWKMKQQMLEVEDRQKARVLAEFKKEHEAAKINTAKLEASIGVNNEAG